MVYRHIAVSQEVYNKIMIECKKEFLEYNPEFKEMKISQNFLLNRIADKYLDNI